MGLDTKTSRSVPCSSGGGNEELEQVAGGKWGGSTDTGGGGGMHACIGEQGMGAGAEGSDLGTRCRRARVWDQAACCQLLASLLLLSMPQQLG